MKNESIFSEFTNLYSVSKTLRFSLIPIGKTLENIESAGFLEKDKERANDYIEIKKLIDNYHRKFIEDCLINCNFLTEDLIEYKRLYSLKKTEQSENSKKEFEGLKKKLRTQISELFTKNPQYKRMLDKELIKEDLPAFLESESDKNLVKKFDRFTTYFTGFNENRKNVYSAEEISTSIPYRIVYDNLPFYLDNCNILEKIKSNPLYSDLISQADFEQYFEIASFNQFVSQTGIEKYNLFLGGKTDENGNKIQGFNEKINLFKQQLVSQKIEFNKKDLPYLQELYKQILSERTTASFRLEPFINDKELVDKLYEFWEVKIINNTEIETGKSLNIMESIQQLMKEIPQFDTKLIYLKNDKQLTNLSNQIFGSWDFISKAIENYYEIENPIKYNKKKEIEKKYLDAKSKYLKSDYFSLYELELAIDSFKTENEELIKLINKPNRIAQYFSEIKIKINSEWQEIIQSIQNNYHNLIKENILSLHPTNPRFFIQNKAKTQPLKTFLDSVIQLQHFIKIFQLKKFQGEKDQNYYNQYESLMKQFNDITNLYNLVRNYVTQKPYSVEKYKLNFENSTLLDGWDENKETANTCILLRKAGLFYLAIMNKNHNKVFEKEFNNVVENCYEKIIYKLLPGPNKMLPKVFFSNSRKNEFNPSDEILENYKKGTHKSDNFNQEHCFNLIDFFKESIRKHEDWSRFNFDFKPTQTYNNISEFYNEVSQQGYKINFRNIPDSYINELIDKGKLYLFKIYNKDFSIEKKPGGKDNLHTLYFKMLLDEDNLKNVVYQLNGGAELFYRKASIMYKDEVWVKGHHVEKLRETNKFSYPIISKKRFAQNSFLFHTPIKTNFKNKGKEYFNKDVIETLKNNDNFNIIGIDRGERNLLYVVVINLQGQIQKQISLNEIINEYKGKVHSKNYHNLLNNKEVSRQESRKNWETIENIKELKEGYLSQVIHKICNLMLEYNAIVILEDLNFGFKNSRIRVEKQVYQKFEKMLIDKLNYLVSKEKKPTELGGLLNAFQLTEKFESFQKLGKQSGFLFYVPAFLTSKIDPTTGFVNLLYPKFETIKQAQEFLNKFESIQYNSQENHFEFSITNLNSFNPKAAGTQQNWTICTNGIRLENFRNKEKNYQWDTKDVKLTNEFKKLLDENNIHYVGGNCIKYEIVQINEAKFFKDLFHLLKLTLQIRNNRTGTDEDFLLSCVKNKDGYFYDSRDKRINQTLPENADANGAYNIARKGLMLIKRVQGELQKYDDKEKVDEKNKLVISNKEWLQFAQENNKL